MIKDNKKFNNIKTKNNWCPYPFHYLMLTPNMEIRPCCRFEMETYQNTEPLSSCSQISDAFNGDFLSSIRDSLSENQAIDGCNKCTHEEKENISSLRQKAIAEESLPLDSRVYINSMEIGVGRLCNLKCRTCSSQYSTSWDEDEKSLNLDQLSYGALNEIDLENFPLEVFDRLEELKVTGGEPFISKSFFKFLEEFEKSGKSKNCTIEVFTNGTIFPPSSVIESLSSFKKVRISLSIDAIGEKNNYIRSPSKWDSLTINFKKWDNWSQKCSSSEIWIATTVNILNVLYLYELKDWIDNFFQKKPHLVLQILHGPKYLSVMNFSNETKNKLNKKLVAICADQNNPKYKKINKILTKLLNSNSNENIESVFFDITHRIDDLRNENYKDVFPDLNEILK